MKLRHAGLVFAALSVLALPALAEEADDGYGYHAHGFSPDGRYFAFEDYGGYHAIAGSWSKIKVIDAQTDRVAHAPFLAIHPDPDEKSPEMTLERTRAENLRKAVPVLRGLGVRFDDRGESPALAVTSQQRLAGRFKLGEDAYTLEIADKPFPSDDCGFGGGRTYGFRLVLTGPKGPRVLHDDARVPASRGRRGCVGGYSLQEVRRKGRYLVVVVNYDMPDIEGRAGNDHLAVGVVLE